MVRHLGHRGLLRLSQAKGGGGKRAEMSRLPSPETEIRNLRSLLRKTAKALREAIDREKAYRTRATQAEQQIAEWQNRFDALLKIVPSGPSAAACGALEEAEKAVRDVRESHERDAGDCRDGGGCDFIIAWETAEERIRNLRKTADSHHKEWELYTLVP